MRQYKKIPAGRFASLAIIMVLPGCIAACCGGGRTVTTSYRVMGRNTDPPPRGGQYTEWKLMTESYEYYPELIGIPDVGPEPGQYLAEVLQELRLENVTECYGSTEGMVLRRAGGGDIDPFNSPELRTLRMRGIKAGPIRRMKGGGFLVFANKISLQFKPSVGSDEQHKNFFGETGITEWRKSNVISYHYEVTIDPGIGSGIHERVERLLETGLLEYAYPSYWVSGSELPYR